MTFSDYLIDILLIGVVVLQVRGRRLTLRSLLLPIGIVTYVGFKYLHGVPTAGNDLVLVAIAVAAGITLGIGAGLFTTVAPGPDGHPVAKAGLVAAGLWVLGVGSRFAFQLYASHGGGPAVGRFSAAHAITTSEAWVAALILMAFGEVIARTAVLALRAYRVAPSHFLGAASMIGTGDRAF